jgi:hypothetical protein
MVEKGWYRTDSCIPAESTISNGFEEARKVQNKTKKK